MLRLQIIMTEFCVKFCLLAKHRIQLGSQLERKVFNLNLNEMFCNKIKFILLRAAVPNTHSCKVNCLLNAGAAVQILNRPNGTVCGTSAVSLLKYSNEFELTQNKYLFKDLLC